jgi:hypothetical protein
MYPKALETDGIHHPGSKEQLGLDIARNLLMPYYRLTDRRLPSK